MGKICYRPKKERKTYEEELLENVETVETIQEEERENYLEEATKEPVEASNEYLENMQMPYEEPAESVASELKSMPNKTRQDKKKLDNVKMIGDMDCDYHIYMEDYVYTYIYQYAFSDLSKENSAILIGEVYLDSKEAIITGMIPIDSNKITDGSEWINLEIVNEIEEVRKQYFKDQDIIGWLHMQPGYGTMLTMKELREHRSVFEGAGSVFMLVDALNKIETVYVYEEEELKEQSGYCMYYEPNEPMQQYMVEHSFAKKETEEIKDTVVNQFREIGKIRKEEYLQKKNRGFTFMATAIILVALAGVIVRMNANKAVQSQIGTPVMSENLTNEIGEGTNTLLVTPNNQVGIEEVVGVEDIEETVAASEVSEEKTEAMEQVVEDTEDVEAVEEVEIVDVASGENNQGTENKEVENKKVDDKESTEVAETQSKEVVQDTAKVEVVESEAKEYEIYIVKQGDTLANISYDKYGDAKKSLEIAKLNGLDSTNNIYVGQELKMPK